MVPTRPFIGFAEPISSWTHLISAVVFLIIGALLLKYKARGVRQVSLIIVLTFATSFLLSMSGVYHLLPPQSLGRVIFQRLDHAAIFVLIAATFTAVHGLLFSGFSRYGMITFVWIIAAVSITLTSIFFDSIPEWISIGLYLAFGWLGMVSCHGLLRDYGFKFVLPLVIGGLAYTAGAIMEFLKEPIIVPGYVGYHELFHLAVIAGISYHWYFVARSLDEQRSPILLRT